MDIEAIRKQVEQQVMQYFHLEPTVTDAPYAGMVTGVDVISHLEHSLLNPDTTLETIERECAVARKYSVAAVCVAPYYVPAAREILLGSPVAVGTAIGFPHGCMSQAAKLAELRECMANGATEVDVALNVLAIKSGRLDVAQRELDELVRCAVGKVQLKAVFEHALYTPEEKRAVLQMLRSSGVNYVKIQNMLSGHGARVEDVRFASEILGRNVGIKIDGGIKKEVSVGCSIGKKVCSICGADRQEATCGHQPGKKYGGRLCYTLLEDPTDAYEWSFVAVPAQPAAGVTKSHAARKALHLTPERAIAEMERGELHLDAAAAYGLRKHIAALEKKSEEAGRYRQSLCETIRRRTMLAQPQMPPALLEKSMAPLTVTELEELAALMKQQAEKRFAPMVQTAPAPENETDNRAFCI